MPAGVDAARAAINTPQQAPSSEFSDIQGLFNSSFALGSISPAVGSLKTQDAVTVANQRAAASASRAAKDDELQAKIDRLKSLFDPKAYPDPIRRPDGGFEFKNPLGASISAKEYAKVQNKRIVDVLKDSDNALDRQFISDFEGLQEIIDSFANNDKKFFDKLKNEDEELYNTLKDAGTPENIVKKFREHYSDYFENRLGQLTAGATAILGLAIASGHRVELDPLGRTGLGDRFTRGIDYTKDQDPTPTSLPNGIFGG